MLQRGMVDDGKTGARLGIGVGPDSGKRGGLEGVETLQEKLGGLEAEVRGLRPLQDEEDDAEIEETRQRDRLKKQRELVRWVLAAPERMATLVRSGRKEEAEMEWAKVKVSLDRWEENGAKGVGDVRKACEEAMKAKPAKDEDEGDNSVDKTATAT